LHTLRIEAENAVVDASRPSRGGLVRIKRIVPEKLVRAAVIFVGSGFRADADNSALIVSELGRRILCDQVDS